MGHSHFASPFSIRPHDPPTTWRGLGRVSVETEKTTPCSLALNPLVASPYPENKTQTPLLADKAHLTWSCPPCSPISSRMPPGHADLSVP